MFDTFLDRFFGKKAVPEAQSEAPGPVFGRWTDMHKTRAQYAAWDRALELFEAKDFLGSLRSFFTYLCDERLQNVRFAEQDGALSFEIWQGSRKVTGRATAEKIRAEAIVAKFSAANVGLMRRLVEHNFNLKYCRFAFSPSDEIAVVFDSFVVDGSPYKLYYALKELAVSADKQDDLLLGEFADILSPVDSGEKEPLPAAERAAKLRFLRSEAQRALNLMAEPALSPEKHPAAYSYLLLNLAYKLDHLVRPEGPTMEALENIHRQFFLNDGKTKQAKNEAVRREIQKMLERPDDQLERELFRTKSAFGVTAPVSHDRVAEIIDGELANMDWYVAQKHVELARAVPGYIATYCLFNFAMPKPDQDLFGLYLQVAEPAFFNELGLDAGFWEGDRLCRKTIIAAIQKIAERHRPDFPKLQPETSVLGFESFPVFARTFMKMMRDLNLSKNA